MDGDEIAAIDWRGLAADKRRDESTDHSEPVNQRSSPPGLTRGSIKKLDGLPDQVRQ
jgi:hypothetical protein